MLHWNEEDLESENICRRLESSNVDLLLLLNIVRLLVRLGDKKLRMEELDASNEGGGDGVLSDGAGAKALPWELSSKYSDVVARLSVWNVLAASCEVFPRTTIC